MCWIPRVSLFKLASLWARRPLVLAFTRHFGCTQCKQMLAELADGRARIKKAGLNIAVVTQGVNPKQTALFAKEFAPGLKVYCDDPERKSLPGLRPGARQPLPDHSKPESPVGCQPLPQEGFSRSNRRRKARMPCRCLALSSSVLQGRVLLPFYYDNIADHPSLDLMLQRSAFNPLGPYPFEGPIGERD